MNFQNDILNSDTLFPFVQDTEEIIRDTVFVTSEKNAMFVDSAKKSTAKINRADSVKITPTETTDTFSLSEITDTISENFPEEKKDSLTVHEIKEIKKNEEALIIHSRNFQNNNLSVTVLLMVFSILAFVKITYAKRLRQLFEAFLNNRYIRQLVSEEFVFTHPSSVALAVVFLLSSALLFTRTIFFFQWGIFSGSEMVVYLKSLFFIAFFFAAKIIIIRLSATLFRAREAITEYLFNLFLFNNILGIVLLPFVISVVFVPVIPPDKLLYFAGGLVLVSFAFRIVKCFLTGSAVFPRLYIFLYICSLEILPVVVIIKVFSR